MYYAAAGSARASGTVARHSLQAAGVSRIGRCSAAAGTGGRRLSLPGCAPGDGAAAAGRMPDLDPAGLDPGREGDGHVQDTIGVAGGEVLRVHSLAE